jgi:hypothetical protein
MIERSETGNWNHFLSAALVEEFGWSHKVSERSTENHLCDEKTIINSPV